MAKFILGLVGATGSGKTTLARKLVGSHGFENIHMGRPIKDMLVALGLPEEAVSGSPADREKPRDLLGGRSTRYALSTLGTQWGRNMITPNIWANAVKQRLEQQGDDSKIVIDDLRFPNDWAVIQHFGGKILTVRRPSVERSRSRADRLFYRFGLGSITGGRGLLGWRPIHETEFHWPDAPSVGEVKNESTVEMLVEEALKFCP